MGETPSPAQIGLGSFLNLLQICSLGTWNLGWGEFPFPFMNQHRIGLCGPEKLLEYKSCSGPSAPWPTDSPSWLGVTGQELLPPRLPAASGLQKPGPRDTTSNPLIPEATCRVPVTHMLSGSRETLVFHPPKSAFPGAS